VKLIALVMLTFGFAATPAQAATVKPPAPTIAPQFTLMMGRGINAQALDVKCTKLSPGPTLNDTAAFLAGYGLKATVPATLNLTSDTDTPVCNGKLVYPTWSQLRELRDTYRWDAIPRGISNDPITSLTGQALYDNTCGVLPKFYSEGFPQAWGLYAYPGNRWTDADQQVVKTCYSYGRKYSGLGPNGWNKMPGVDPWWHKALSVNGGQCNDATLPCYTDPLVRNLRRYMTPAQLDASVSTALGTWSNIQFYRLVTGSQGTASSAAGVPAWDCTSADPAQHWSHLPEEYCYDDFKAFVAGLPLGIVNSNPAEVAALYGRVMVTP
jgi:hypothetical protein